jgi:hypothetical protein
MASAFFPSRYAESFVVTKCNQDRSSLSNPKKQPERLLFLTAQKRRFAIDGLYDYVLNIQ